MVFEKAVAYENIGILYYKIDLNNRKISYPFSKMRNRDLGEGFSKVSSWEELKGMSGLFPTIQGIFKMHQDE